MTLESILDDLEREYAFAEQHMALNSHGPHPIKNCDILDVYDNGTPSVYTNSMYARLSDGTFGTKLIYVNEKTGFAGGRVVVYGPSGAMLADIDCGELTQIRCGLMAALCLRKFRKEFEHPFPFYVAIVGAGKIASGVFSVLTNLNVKIYVLDKNKLPLYYNGVELVPTKLGPNMDVVITCTSANTKQDLVTIDEFPLTGLFISFDGGYYLGPQFRDPQRFQVLADHPAQIREHFDHEFPWDRSIPSFATLSNIGQSRKPDTVHLFGVAMADVYAAAHYQVLREMFPCTKTLSSSRS